MLISILFFFFFNDTATTEIYTLSLHDALPIYGGLPQPGAQVAGLGDVADDGIGAVLGLEGGHELRSEEHTSELQSQSNLVCRLLLEKKKKKKIIIIRSPHNIGHVSYRLGCSIA